MLPWQICCFRKNRSSTCWLSESGNSIGRDALFLFLHSSDRLIHSLISYIRCKVIAGDSHFQTWLKKKGPKSQQCLTSPCRGCGKWFGPANHKHRQPCFRTLCSPFQVPINLCSIHHPHLQTQTQTFLDVSGVLQVPKCLGATKARLTIPKWSVSILIANRLGVWNQQQPGHVALTQCFFFSS